MMKLSTTLRVEQEPDHFVSDGRMVTCIDTRGQLASSEDTMIDHPLRSTLTQREKPHCKPTV